MEGSTWTRTCSSKGKFLRGEPVRFTMKFRYTRPFAEPMCQPEIDDFTFLSPPRNSNFLRDDWINFPPFFSPETITMHLIAMQNDRTNRGIAKKKKGRREQAVIKSLENSIRSDHPLERERLGQQRCWHLERGGRRRWCNRRVSPARHPSIEEYLRSDRQFKFFSEGSSIGYLEVR